MQRLFEDVRLGVRLLWKSPAFTLTAMAALALGTGANTAIFSAVDAVLLRPLPFRDPDRLAVIWEKSPTRNRNHLYVSPANYLEWRARSRSLPEMGALQPVRMNLTAGPNGRIDPEEIAVERVTASLLPVLGVQPLFGRGISAEEEQSGRTNLVLLGHRLWRRRFGGDPAITGKSIRLRDQNCTVLGVMPAGFSILNADTDAWIPLALNPGDPRGGVTHTLIVFARLAPGASWETARTELDGIGKRLAEERPGTNAGEFPSLFSVREEILGEVRIALLVLFAAVALLLLIACVNVANLSLARAASRQKEIALRIAVGAARARIFTQLLTESLILGLAGGAAGLVLAWAGIRALLELAPAGIPRLQAASLDVRLLGFTLLVSLGSGLLFGVAPALQASTADLNETLKEGGRGGTAGRRRRHLRDGLVTSEIALAAVVLVSAGLLVRSFLRLRAADPGFPAANLLTYRVPLGGSRNTAEPRRIVFFHEILTRAAALPGVRSAGAVNTLPLAGLGLGTTFAIEGRPAPSPEQRPIGLLRSASTGYFRTMGIPLRSGREFNAFDRADSTPVAIVNETLARRFWPGADSLGARIVLDSPSRSVEVVGIAGDVKPERLQRDDWPTLYLPYPQAPAASMTVVLRTAGDPSSLARAAAAEVRHLDPDQPVADVRSMEQVLSEAMATARFDAVLLSIFAVVAFLLAAVGIYGVVSYSVTERAQEIGIRLALGAAGTDILRLVLGESARLAAAGLALGLAAAFALTRLMGSLLYTVRADDFATFVLIPLLLGGVALLASYFPSRRAAALDPVDTLRRE